MIFIFLFSFFSEAQELQRFCFPSVNQLNAAKNEFKQFKNTQEELLAVSDVCFDLVLFKQSRVEFWSSFLSKRHGASAQNSIEFPTHECHIKVRKISQNQNNNNKLSITKKPLFIHEKKQGENYEESFIRVLSGKNASLGFDNEELNFKCTFKSNGIYEIEFKQKLSEVTNYFYTINQIPFWTQVNNTKESLVTCLTLSKGQIIEVAQIKRNSNNRDKKIDTSTGIDFKQSEGSIFQKIFLSIE